MERLGFRVVRTSLNAPYYRRSLPQSMLLLLSRMSILIARFLIAVDADVIGLCRRSGIPRKLMEGFRRIAASDNPTWWTIFFMVGLSLRRRRRTRHKVDRGFILADACRTRRARISSAISTISA
ncbi:hypothetical protein V1505DRAFT_381673 [Lipomyces doorenjongii]